MSHTRFIDFLDEYNIHEPSDYSKIKGFEKRKFLIRLNGFAKREKERVEPDLLEDIGLKMHYHISRHPQHGWQNIPNETLSRKLAFFSGRTIITFPFHDVHTEDSGVQALLKTLCAARPFMEEDMVNVFPSTNKWKHINQNAYDKKYGLVSANFKLMKLEKQFKENFINYKNIYLPIFNNVSARDVIDIRKENDVLYTGLELRLSELLSGNINTDDRILVILQDIDKHVRKLITRFEAIKKAYEQKNIYRILGLVKIIVAMIDHPVSTIVNMGFGEGSQLAIDAINDTVAYKDIAEDEYFLFWRMNDPDGNKLM